MTTPPAQISITLHHGDITRKPSFAKPLTFKTLSGWIEETLQVSLSTNQPGTRLPRLEYRDTKILGNDAKMIPISSNEELSMALGAGDALEVYLSTPDQNLVGGELVVSEEVNAFCMNMMQTLLKGNRTTNTHNDMQRNDQNRYLWLIAAGISMILFHVLYIQSSNDPRSLFAICYYGVICTFVGSIIGGCKGGLTSLKSFAASNEPPREAHRKGWSKIISLINNKMTWTLLGYCGVVLLSLFAFSLYILHKATYVPDWFLNVILAATAFAQICIGADGYFRAPTNRPEGTSQLCA